MLAKFYNNKSDERYVNKNIELKHDNIDIKLKNDTELVRPVLVLQSGLLNPSVNYVWIENFGRYYFIRDTKLTQGMVEISCECDVLSSFKTALLKQNVIVSRQERNYNLYQSDPKQHFYNTNATIIKEFPIKPFSINNSNFILVLNGASVSNS
jgi:hypothetical protein